MAKMQTEPTSADWSTLARALDLEERFQAGVFPVGGAQTAHFEKLCRFGMLEATGKYGRDIDGEVERDVPLYRLTDQGREWVRAREAAASSGFAHHAEEAP